MVASRRSSEEKKSTAADEAFAGSLDGPSKLLLLLGCYQ